jgi:hypothetical protein
MSNEILSVHLYERSQKTPMVTLFQERIKKMKASLTERSQRTSIKTADGKSYFNGKKLKIRKKSYYCSVCGKRKITSENPVVRECYIQKYNGICTCSDNTLIQNPFDFISAKKPSLDDYDFCRGREILEDRFSLYENILS